MFIFGGCLKAPKEEDNMNNDDLNKRFDSIDTKVEGVRKLATDTKIIVSDGLQDRMIKVEKSINWLTKIIITLLLMMLASTITLYTASNKRMDEVLIKIERINGDIAN